MTRPNFRKVFKIAGIVSLILILASCLIIYQLFSYGCLWWECAPKRTFTVFDLNLPKEHFPSGADIHDLQPLRGENVPVEAASTANYWNNGVAIYIVRRFATETQASRDYGCEAQLNFTKQLSDIKEYSDIITYESKIANVSSVQCGYVLDDLRCIYVARYEEFTVFFSGSIGDGEMSRDDFLGVISYIDDRMKSLLKDEIQ